MMEFPLVVGIDGSEPSLDAVDWAVDEAARHSLPLRLVCASLWERYEGARPSVIEIDRPVEHVWAERIVTSSLERARMRNPDVKVSSEVLPEDAVTALLRESHEAFAVVTGSRGRSEITGLLLGSVSLSVAARAVCPVVVVRGEEPNRQGAFHKLVLGIGDAVESAAAVRFALREAEARHCAVHAVRAWRAPAHDGVAHPLIAPDAAVRAHEGRASTIVTEALRRAERNHPRAQVHRAVVEGSAQKVLLDMSADADLVVVGAQRRHGYFGLQLGRVNHALLHHSHCPVAVVPQRA
jgi:nucleotide-binding universal stress UspA family protein